MEQLEGKGDKRRNEMIKSELDALNGQINIAALKENEAEGRSKIFKNANGKNLIQIELYNPKVYVVRAAYSQDSDCFMIYWEPGYSVEKLLTIEIRHQGEQMAQTTYINAWKQHLEVGKFVYDIASENWHKIGK